MAFRDFSDLSDELRLSGGEAALLLIIPDPGTDKDLVVDLLDQSTVLEGTDWSVCFGGGRTLLLVGQKTWASLIASAARIYEIYSVLHPIRMAVCRLNGWPCDYATAWQRALDADEVLNHAQNSIAYGIYDLRMQRLTPIGIERSRAASVQSAIELYQRGLHLEAGFVLFEGFSTSELRVAWLRDILQLCEETYQSCRPLLR